MDIIKSNNRSILSALERLTYIYIIVYILAMQMSPWGFVLERICFRPLTIFAAKRVGINIETFSGGSGDTTYDYCKLVILFLLSVLLFLIFFIKSKSFENTRLRIWTFTALRYFLALYLLIYGLSKVFPLQFGNGIHAYTLSKTYGEATPMNLLWTFMGHSRPYTIFAGLSEVIAGLFFLFRRTTLLGALTSFGVMLNVFLLNLFYDVPVKIFSGHLLLFSIFIAGYYIKPLLNLFLYNKTAEPLELPGFNFTPNEHQFLLIFKKLFVGIIVILVIGSFFGLSNLVNRSHIVKSDAEGIHRIINFEKHNEILVELSDNIWDKVIIYEDDGWMIHFENGKRKFEEISIDTTNKVIKDTSDGYLNYTLKNDTFNMRGKWQGDSLNLTTVRTNIEDLPLNKRKFHFINETPFNR